MPDVSPVAHRHSHGRHPLNGPRLLHRFLRPIGRLFGPPYNIKQTPGLGVLSRDLSCVESPLVHCDCRRLYMDVRRGEPVEVGRQGARGERLVASKSRLMQGFLRMRVVCEMW